MTVELRELKFTPQNGAAFLIHKCANMTKAEEIAMGLRHCGVEAVARELINGDVGTTVVVQVPVTSEDALTAAGVTVERPAERRSTSFAENVAPGATSPDSLSRDVRVASGPRLFDQ